MLIQNRGHWEPGEPRSLLDVLSAAAMPFVRALSDLERIYFALAPLGGRVQSINLVMLAALKNDALDLETSVEALQLRFTLRSVQKLQQHLEFADWDDSGNVSVSSGDISKICTTIDDIRSRLRDELARTVFYTMTEIESRMHNPDGPLFGDEVDRAFPPDVAEDISEAGRCYAFGRYTGVVFHVMRATERALQVIALKLGATIVDKNNVDLSWGVIADALKGKIDAMPKGASQTSWYRVQAYFVTLNRAFRTPTMHPKQTYTEDQAREVMDAVRSFLVHLAPLV